MTVVGLFDWSILSVEGIVTVGTWTELVRVVCAWEGLAGMAWIVPGCWNWRGMRAGVGEFTFWRMYTGCPLGSVYIACTMGAVMFVGVLAMVGGEVERETEGWERRGSDLLLWLQAESSALSSCEI